MQFSSNVYPEAGQESFTSNAVITRLIAANDNFHLKFVSHNTSGTIGLTYDTFGMLATRTLPGDNETFEYAGQYEIRRDEYA